VRILTYDIFCVRFVREAYAVIFVVFVIFKLWCVSIFLHYTLHIALHYVAYAYGSSYVPAVYLPLTAATSTFGSPVQSARGAKRRVTSSSTLSSDLTSDIIPMIRCSPTEIVPVVLAGSSTVTGRPLTSSTQFGRLCSGSISHLSARNSVTGTARSQHRQQLIDVRKKFTTTFLFRKLLVSKEVSTKERL